MYDKKKRRKNEKARHYLQVDYIVYYLASSSNYERHDSFRFRVPYYFEEP